MSTSLDVSLRVGGEEQLRLPVPEERICEFLYLVWQVLPDLLLTGAVVVVAHRPDGVSEIVSHWRQ